MVNGEVADYLGDACSNSPTGVAMRVPSLGPPVWACDHRWRGHPAGSAWTFTPGLQGLPV